MIFLLEKLCSLVCYLRMPHLKSERQCRINKLGLSWNKLNAQNHSILTFFFSFFDINNRAFRKTNSLGKTLDTRQKIFLQPCTGPYLAIQGHTGPYGAIRGHMGPHGTIRGNTGSYNPYMGPYVAIWGYTGLLEVVKKQKKTNFIFCRGGYPCYIYKEHLPKV